MRMKLVMAMTTPHEPLHRLARDLRVHGPVLLAGMPAPHDELLTLVWGPRFDREHALGLVHVSPRKRRARCPRCWRPLTALTHCTPRPSGACGR